MFWRDLTFSTGRVSGVSIKSSALVRELCHFLLSSLMFRRPSISCKHLCILDASSLSSLSLFEVLSRLNWLRVTPSLVNHRQRITQRHLPLHSRRAAHTILLGRTFDLSPATKGSQSLPTRACTLGPTPPANNHMVSR